MYNPHPSHGIIGVVPDAIFLCLTVVAKITMNGFAKLQYKARLRASAEKELLGISYTPADVAGGKQVMGTDSPNDKLHPVTGNTMHDYLCSNHLPARSQGCSKHDSAVGLRRHSGFSIACTPPTPPPPASPCLDFSLGDPQASASSHVAGMTCDL